MTAPAYNAGTDTVVYVGNAGDASNADITTMGAAPLGSAPRIVTHPSPVSPFGASAITSTQQVVTGKGGIGKAFAMTYPTGDTFKAQDFIVCNPAVPPTDPTHTHYIQFACQFTDTGDGSMPLPIKFFRFLFNDAPGGGTPQWSTHYRVSMQNSATDHVTYWQYVAGGDDPEGDQATQPIGPYYNALRGSWANYVIEFRTHSSEKEADGVTAATLALTATSPGTAGTGGTAVFSKSMAGLLSNGQKIGVKGYIGDGGHNVYGGYTVSAFDGDRTCTLTPVMSNMFSPASGTTSGLHFSLALDGCARIYLNGIKILDVSKAAVGVTPPGGDKPWCSQSLLASILTDTLPTNSYVLWFGGDHSSNTPTYDTTMTVNIGDGDPTNVDTLTWFTRPYSPPLLTHLAVATQVSSSTVSGFAHTQQPVVNLMDADDAVVIGEDSTVTASLIVVSGTGTAIGTLARDAVAGVATFTDLGVASAAGGRFKWRFTVGALTVDTVPFTVQPQAPSSDACVVTCT